MKPQCNSPPNTLCVLLFIVDTDPWDFFSFWLLCLEWRLHQFTSAADSGGLDPPTTTTITTTKLWGQFQCSDRHSTCNAFTVPYSKWWIKFNENVLLTSCELKWNPEVLGLLPVRGEFRDRWVVGGLKAFFCNTWFEVLTIKEKKHNRKAVRPNFVQSGLTEYS